MRDAGLVLHREINALGLLPVAQRGVEEVEAFPWSSEHSPLQPACPRSRAHPTLPVGGRMLPPDAAHLEWMLWSAARSNQHRKAPPRAGCALRPSVFLIAAPPALAGSRSLARVTAACGPCAVARTSMFMRLKFRLQAHRHRRNPFHPAASATSRDADAAASVYRSDQPSPSFADAYDDLPDPRGTI